MTLDEATTERDAAVCVEKDGTRSRRQGVREVLETHRGPFRFLSTGRGSHDWLTAAARVLAKDHPVHDHRPRLEIPQAPLGAIP